LAVGLVGASGCGYVGKTIRVVGAVTGSKELKVVGIGVQALEELTRDDWENNENSGNPTMFSHKPVATTYAQNNNIYQRIEQLIRENPDADSRNTFGAYSGWEDKDGDGFCSSLDELSEERTQFTTNEQIHFTANIANPKDSDIKFTLFSKEGINPGLFCWPEETSGENSFHWAYSGGLREGEVRGVWYSNKKPIGMTKILVKD